jgi:Aerotolerance regulator N-terminal/von Willebrand factor type A domain
MSFLSPWFLVSLLGVGIPLAIHLSHKQKTQKVVFSTLRFLKRTPKKIIFFQQIQQWLLLLTRAAIVALLAVAFARPFFGGAITGPPGLSPRSMVIVLDSSMSMQYGDYFDRAKKAALEVLRSLHTGDEAALITFAEGTGQVRELTTDLTRIAAFVPTLNAPGFQGTAYLAALRLADQMLRSARYPDKTVVLISDYQRRAFENLDAGWRLSPGVAFKSIKIGDRETTNLAVTEVKSPAQVIRDQEEHIILGRVRNLGTQPLSEARVSLAIDDQTVDTRKVELTDKSETVVRFRTKFRKRGVYRGALTVADDRFAPDNTFYFTVNVLMPLRVLAVIDESTARGRTPATQWLESALGRRDGSRFQLDTLRPRQVTREAIAACNVIVLLDVKDLGPTQLKAVESFVQKGGSLLMAPAERVAASVFNRLLGGLTPARLDQKHIDLDGDFRVIAEINQRHPIIRALQIGQNNDLGAARFRGYWSTTPVEGSEIIMRFDNGQAALLEGRVGRGRVMLFTSSLDTAWNNFPLQGMYLPLMQETLRYLALQEEKKRSYTVGEPVRMKVPPGNALRVTAPLGTETILTSASGDDVVYRNTRTPGFYSVRGGDHEDFLAVNVSPLESDLSSVAPEEIQEALTNPATAAQPRAQARASAMNVQTEKSQRLWWWILLVVGLMGLGETLLANRTYR